MTRFKNGDGPTSRLRRAGRAGRILRLIAAFCAAWALVVWLVTVTVPPPAAAGLAGAPRQVSAARYLSDDSWLDANGQRQLQQTIFDALFTRIAAAQQLVYIDMFLFNSWQGPVPEIHRALADELADRLVGAATRPDGPRVVLVTDPINTVYGGLAPDRLARLADAGVIVVNTDLTVLQDSNPAWSSLWRWLIRPLGNAPGAETLPNPFGSGRVSLRSWLALLNFKANHRKLAIYDIDDASTAAGQRWATLVTSANPHDGSSAHRNIALEVSGAIVADVLEAERQLLDAIGASDALAVLDGIETPATVTGARADAGSGEPTVQLLNESAIRESLLETLALARRGDAVDLEMFYLAERSIVRALGEAAGRGASVRVLLDVNSDAFGRAKNGVPNRPVAAELVDAGVQVRWCATDGEQCHAKWVHVRRAAVHAAWTGSGNLTRRNLDDFNLETDLVYRAGSDDPVIRAMLGRFDALWDNSGGRTYSLPYATHADDSRWLTWQYRIMEATGLGTF